MTNLQTIKSSKDFQLAKKGLFVRSHSFLIQAYQSEEKIIRVGYTVSKQNGNAIIRNKIKRRLRNIMNDAIDSININLNYSYLFIAKKNIYDDNYKIIKETIFKDLIKVK